MADPDVPIDSIAAPHAILAAMQYAESILDLVGGTPLVRISRADPRPRAGGPPAAPAGQARDAQSGRLGQGPHRPADDRGGRAGRAAPAGRHDHRADVGQHGPRPGDRRRPQGLPLHLRDGRQAVGREAAAAAGVRRRGRPVPDQRRARNRPRATTRWRPGWPATSRARSSPTSTGTRENPAAHERTTGPELWDQTDGRITHFVASVGTGGTISGAAHALKARNPAIQVIGADPEGQRPVGRHGAALPDRRGGGGLLPRDLRSRRDRPLGPRQRPRRVRDGAPAHARGGHPRRRLVRHGDRRRPRGRPRAGRDARRPATQSSSSSSPTAAGTTCPRSTTTSGCARTGCWPRPAQSSGSTTCSHDRHHAGPLPDLVIARTTQRVGEAIAVLQEYGISQLPVSEQPDGDALDGHRRLDHREGPARPRVPRSVDRRADGRRGDGPAAAACRRRDEPRRGVRAPVRRVHRRSSRRAPIARSAS